MLQISIETLNTWVFSQRNVAQCNIKEPRKFSHEIKSCSICDVKTNSNICEN
jgi:hypothetical protein